MSDERYTYTDKDAEHVHTDSCYEWDDNGKQVQVCTINIAMAQYERSVRRRALH